MGAAAKRQAEIPGTERDTIEAIDEAAVKYRALRDERMSLQKDESAARAVLFEVVRQSVEEGFLDENNEGEVYYRFVDGELEYDVILRQKQTVKVKRAVADDAVVIEE